MSDNTNSAHGFTEGSEFKTETKEMEGEFEGHTPGPLEVLHTQSDGFAIDYNNGNLMRRFIAMKIYNKGDANLFAAAPTLLKENQSLRSELQKAKELNGELVGYLKRIMTREIFKEHFNIEQVEELIKKSES